MATMSFSEERVRLREGLLRLVDAGVSVRVAAESLGVSTGSAYWMLRGAGQLAGMRRVITDAHRARVVEVFDASGSVNRAASVSKLGYPVARRILVEAGRVSAQPRPRGKAAARARFLELVGQGWPSTGTTSLWPDRINPGLGESPKVAKRLAFFPVASCVSRVFAPWLCR